MMMEDILIKLQMAKEEGLEDELGGELKVVEDLIICGIDEPYVVVENPEGVRFMLTLSSCNADAHLVVERVTS